LPHKSLEIAARIVALQPKALEKLRPKLRDKTRIIYQSAELVLGNSNANKTKRRKDKPASTQSVAKRSFDVCVIGHLRAVKDPFRAALAARFLPSSSRIRVLQIGKAMTSAMGKQARAEGRLNQRYRWLGGQPRSRTLRVLAQSQLCVISSRLEGGANVMSEAIVASVPILASRIDGNAGILGEDYPGFFPAGDSHQLALLLRRAESEPRFLSELKTRVKKLTPLFDPAREEKAWSDLISELHLKHH